MSLLSILKKAGVDAVDASKPVAVLFGTVIRNSPLEINVEQRFNLTREFLVLTASVQSKEVTLNLSHSHKYEDAISVDDNETEEKETGQALSNISVPIREGLSVGDAVVLLRVQGGQQYVVLDKVVG